MALDERFIDELKQKNNIVDVVGKYCTLKKQGNNHWACCPLPGHSEKTPSFTVNESGQFFKCFGCGQGGDVITFIKTMENLDYIGAVRLLAEQAGMAMPDDNRDYKEIAAARSERDKLLSLLRESALFYVGNLRSKDAVEHNKYLLKRGIDKKTVTAFGIGASLDMFGLPNHLKGKGFTEDEMVNSGVCSRRTNDKGVTYVFDAQYGRLVIPIINNLGSVVGFGGRLLEKNPNFAKYKNTQETKLFVKNRTLYNINNLKKEKALGKLKSVIMVEGYMDTISVYQGGFRNVVASMGTSLTVEQARLLKRYTDTVYISYDGDGAGQKATIRGLEILKNEGLEVRVVRLPDGLDPDDVIKKFGAEKYAQLLEESIPLIDFKMDNLARDFDLGDISQKRKYIAEAIKVISQCQLESEREELLRKLGKATNTTYEALKRDVDNVEQGKEIISVKEEKVNPDGDGFDYARRFVLCALIFNKKYAKDLDLYTINFSDPVHMKIADIIMDYKDEGREVFAASLAENFDASELSEYNAVLTAGDNVFGTPNEDKFFRDCVKTLKKNSLEQELKQLNLAFKNETDTQKRTEIVKAIQQINAKLARF